MKYFRSAPEKKINVFKYFDKISNYMKEKSEQLRLNCIDCLKGKFVTE